MLGSVSMQGKLRAAFASKEKAEAFLENLDKLKEEKAIAGAQYSVLKIEYTQMREDSISEINSIKNDIKRELDSKASKLEILKQEMAYLEARFKVGQITATNYLSKEKGPKGKLIDLEKQISQLLKFINATKSSALGVPESGVRIFGFDLGFGDRRQPSAMPPSVFKEIPLPEPKPATEASQPPPPMSTPQASPPPLPPLYPTPPPLPPSPPPVAVTDLQIMPGRVTEGGSVGIIAMVTNVSPGNLQYKLELKLNSQVKDSKMLEMFFGESQEITFVVAAESPGDYQVELNDSAGRFIVVPAEHKGIPGDK
jgi:hypothetical protein